MKLNLFNLGLGLCILMVKASFRFKFISFYTKLILIQLDLKKDAAEKNVCKIALADLLMAEKF